MNASFKSPSVVLLFCQPISMAHVVRAVRLAQLLRRHWHVDIMVCTTPTALPTFVRAGFRGCEIRVPDKEAVYARLVAGGDLYLEADLKQELAQDLRLLETHRPDLVVSEFRFSAQEAARRLGIPCLTVTEAACLPGYDACGPFPDSLAKTLPLPLRALDWTGSKRWLGLVMQRIGDRRSGSPYRRAFGADAPARGFFDFATQGDLCAASDLPELMPAALRSQDVYIGPLFWDRDDPLPPELDALESGRKTVYVSIGTQRSLDPRVLDEAIDRLLRLGMQIVYSLGGRHVTPPAPRARLHVVPFVNDARLLPLVDLVIYPGGAMTTYEALRAGVPLLALPQHINQHFYAWRVKQSGVGDWLRPSEFSADQLVARAQRLLESPTAREQARHLSRRIAAFDSHVALAPRLRAWLRPRTETITA